MRKGLYLTSLVALAGIGGGAALGQGIFLPSYNQTTSFDGAPGALEPTSRNMTYDGRNYWSASGGGSNGNRLA